MFCCRTVWACLGMALGGAVSAASLYAGPNDPIYGINFYGDSPAVENTIKNGKDMWTLEMIYTQSWYNPAGERQKYLNIKNKGFKIIMRLDYQNGVSSIPPAWDWVGRYNHAQTAGQIAATLGDIVDVWQIGNEMTTQPSPYNDSQWYAYVFNAYDQNCVYDQIHANDPDAIVCIGALTAWPYHVSPIEYDNITWLREVQNYVDQQNGEPQIDGYCLHSYSGSEYYNDPNSPTEDPRFSDVTGLRSFIPFMRTIYEKHGDAVPIYITEANTYWFNTGFADVSYRANWMQEAFQTVDEWNQCSDMKIHAFCWYTYSNNGIWDPSHDMYGCAMMRTDNALLNQARADFSWVTANTHLVPGSPGSTLRFQAENYTNSAEWLLDVGKAGTDYYDTTSANQGGAYRNGNESGGHVDIEALADGSGFAVGWTVAGEWLRYETLAGGREYEFKVRYARGTGGTGRIRVLVDEVSMGDVTLAPTGGWSNYSEVTGPTFYMGPGYHYIKIYHLTGDVNLDWFELTVSGAGADTEPPTVPTGLAGTVTAPDTVYLTWNASTDNVAVVGYEIRRAGVTIDTTTATNYTDTPVALPADYEVRAYDAAPNYSAWTDPITVAEDTPAWDSAFHAQNYPLYMEVGESVEAWVEFENAGTETWNAWEVAVGTADPQDRSSPFCDTSWSGCNRPTYLEGAGIPTNSIGRFTFTLTAPSTPGTYVETYRLLRENVTWFGPEFSWTIYVTEVIPPPSVPDFDTDGDVDQDDFGRFQVCMTGSATPQSDPACALARLSDDDPDVDANDLAVFVGCLSGANVAYDPQCLP